ncbi:LARGE xylosyl- and glucuronyltransferase 2-like isoform X2 [Branchiostoma floridae]|uniref:LARGE xylosyl- and glucuronyltransferase 2-like isoform X2 n=1 Tax=Branchiostoma floridae TaxID=7739 RepID=A0A9J7M7H4_BRAFL|nr:LARGE xylosyl- and glucuronyltransferase 2-like isoform X2 [Branchiostoma floridae]
MTSRRKLARRAPVCSLTAILWIAFGLSLTSVIVTVLYLPTLRSQPAERKKQELKPDVVEDWDGNVLLDQMTDQTHISVGGWWVPHVRWEEEVSCTVGGRSLCQKVLSVMCKADSVRAVYQYLPIRPDTDIKTIYFSARSAAVDLQSVDSVHDADYSAIAMVKFDDGSHQTLRLDFPSGSHPFIAAENDMGVPNNQKVVSVLVMLFCHGYMGLVKFTDIILKPVGAGGMIATERGDIVSSCPPALLSPVSATKPTFHYEHIFNATFTEYKEDTVTLVTQVSMDRIAMLDRIIRHWDGPMAVALYVPTTSQKPDTNHDWKRYYINKKLRHPKFRTFCSVLAVYANVVNDEYPINYLRNLALRMVKSKYVFLLDADFIPSPNFQDNFRVLINDQSDPTDRTAYVVPAFEFLEEQEDQPPPQDKEALKQQIFADDANILPFRSVESPESHRPTDYQRWYAEEQVYPVSTYQDKFEPYLVLRMSPSLPLYDERFSGYGMNKVTHTMELLAAGYQFLVLPNVWAIHVPHRSTSSNIQFLQKPLQRLHNRATRFEFVADIMRKYQVGPCSTKPKR